MGYSLLEHMRESFISEIVDEYLRLHPPDKEGLAHVEMERLEIEAVNQIKEEGILWKDGQKTRSETRA
jgi:hypothetical protein